MNLSTIADRLDEIGREIEKYISEYEDYDELEFKNNPLYGTLTKIRKLAIFFRKSSKK